MDTRSVVIGYALGYNAGGGGGGGEEIEVEWKYPDDWPPLPKAGEKECILLIRPSSNRKKIAIALSTFFYYNYLSELPDYHVDIDWGDGNVEVLDNNQLSEQWKIDIEHEYSDEFVGQYLFVRIQTMYEYVPLSDGDLEVVATSINGFGSTGSIFNVLAASLGTHTYVTETKQSFNPFYVRFEMTDINESSVDRSHYSEKSKHAGYYRELFSVFVGYLTKRIDYTGSPEIFGSGYSAGMLNNLRTIQGTESIKKIHYQSSYMLSSNYSLEKISFPGVEEIDGYFLGGGAYGLRIINIPKCTKITGTGIIGGYCLQKVIVAKGCEIDPAAIQSNYQYVDVIEIEEEENND